MRVETDRFRDCAIFKDGYWHSELFGEPNGKFQAKLNVSARGMETKNE